MSVICGRSASRASIIITVDEEGRILLGDSLAAARAGNNI